MFVGMTDSKFTSSDFFKIPDHVALSLRSGHITGIPKLSVIPEVAIRCILLSFIS